MDRRGFLRAGALGAAALAWPARGQAARPNVVFILADDLGWMDLGVMGSGYYRTPQIDRLAARGVRFTQAYAANPLCSPTRASLMTGLYPARLGITRPGGHLPPLPPDTPDLPPAPPWQAVLTPNSRRFLPPGERTLGEAFRDAGYRTGFCGKWHLGLQPEHWPEAQGFEEVFHGAPDPGPRSYFSPYRFAAGTVTDGPEGEYLTDRLTTEALGFIDRHRDEPFFLCLWEYAVHAPFQGRPDYVEEHRAVTDPRGEQASPTMAAMIRSLDDSVGRVMEHLDRTGLADRTIVVFLSDNGGNLYNTVDGTTPTSNRPLRGGKANIYEGGVRVPCIVVWPGVTTPGRVSDEVISSIDFYPTLLDMAGVGDVPGKLLDGESFAPVLRGTGTMTRPAVFFDFPHYEPQTGNLPACSVRQGDWKLIRFFDVGPPRGKDLLGNHPLVRRPEGEFELYNLRGDLSEGHNLAAQEPARVRALNALITAHLGTIGAVVPVPNPAWRPEQYHPMFDEPFDGWIPGGTAGAEAGEGTVKVISYGADPILQTSEVPAVTGPVQVRLRLRLATRGQGQLFWSSTAHRRYFRDRSVRFELRHDGAWHEYTLEFTIAGTLLGLRLDPGDAEGVAELDWLRLSRPDGELLQAWEYGGPAREP